MKNLLIKKLLKLAKFINKKGMHRIRNQKSKGTIINRNR